MTVCFSDIAWAQLQLAVVGLEQLSSNAAAQFQDAVDKRLKAICRFPRSGHIVAHYGKTTHFRFLVGSYLFYYRIEEASIYVLLIAPAKSNFQESTLEALT